MSVQDGQQVSAAVTNPAYLKPDVTDWTVSILGSQNSTSGYGPWIADFKHYLNNIGTQIGLNVSGNYTAESDATLNTYGTPTGAVANGLNFKQAVTTLSSKFAPLSISGGHQHTGANGDGPQISATNLSNFNSYATKYQVVTITGVSGIDDVVTAFFAGRASGGTASFEGVLTTAPDNYVEIRTSDTDVTIKDAGGQKIYGRVTVAGGVWTLTYYTNEAGVETSASISGPISIAAYFRQVYQIGNTPTIEASVLEALSKDPTADIVSASATQRGLMSTGTQAFAGLKTFNADLEFLNALYGDSATDSTTTGALQTLALPATWGVRVSNASLTSIQGITAPSPNRMLTFILMNLTGSAITIKYLTGTSSAQIDTGTGADFTLGIGASLLIARDKTSGCWRVVGGSSGGGGSFPNPMTSPGDMIAGTTAGAPVRVPVGTSGQFLVSAGAATPAWQTVATIAQGGTNNGSLPVTAGGVVTTDGSKQANTGAGTAGQVLVSAGAAAPGWQSISGTYAPTVTAGTGINVISARFAAYIIIGDVCFISGLLQCTTTTAGTSGDFTMTLPVTRAANFSGTDLAGGSIGMAGTTVTGSGQFAAMSGTKLLTGTILQNSANSRGFGFSLAYKLTN